MKDVFASIYEHRRWGGSESRSGPGSSLRQTEAIRRAIPELVRRYRVTTLLDVPCGDWNWMSQVDLDCQYVGGDIVDTIIRANRARYPGVDFRVMDLTESVPAADLVLSRDCLVHLPFEWVHRAISVLRASGSGFVLMTHFPLIGENADLGTIGDWRPLNFRLPPFNLPPPLEVVEEGFWAKTLALWRVSDLRTA